MEQRFRKPNINLEDTIVQLTQQFYDEFAKPTLELEDDPTVFYDFDEQAEQNPLKQHTGLFNPDNNSIVIFCHGRHPKDILRSFAHELVHYSQNVKGAISPEVKQRLLQGADIDDPVIQSIEGPAYRNGSFMLRKFTSSLHEGLDIIIQKSRQSKEEKVRKPRDPAAIPLKFQKLEELRKTVGPKQKTNTAGFLRDEVVEFDNAFQDTFNEVFEEAGFFLANYYEPGRFYEYVLEGENNTMSFSIFPSGDDEFNTGRDEPVLQVSEMGKDGRNASDYSFTTLHQLFKKVTTVLKQKKGATSNERS